ncbi:ABC transporter substrate-binding protein [Microvirga sp. VF16]|uniref:ABC transporter substrate-binding protein n=1 Tax=Microvirga sp. VF16 TaxID=2807101 RepID=UPI00193E9CCC|nr:ABC transporter substrate-binding protein [Microvirga sp. VF16]QRM32380.1 ABC transporter substrate-binding protein [Microvirga sp. VF16]
MRMRPIVLIVGLSACLFGSVAHAETTLNVLYAIPSNFKDIQEKIAAKFQEEHPDIKIVFRAPPNTYDEATAQVLRSSLIGDQPDVYFNGINQVRIVADRGKAVPISAFADKTELDNLGYLASMTSLGDVEGKSYGLPFAISTPVLYVNEDLLTAAGRTINDFPTNWEGIIDLGRRIASTSPGKTGFLFGYNTSGNWLYQALVTSHGGRMGAENGCKAIFDDEHGTWALAMLERFTKAGMPDMGWQQGRQAFAAGEIGIYAESSASVALMERNVAGKFKMRTMPFPLASGQGSLPAGGSIAMILAVNKDKQRAAWEYVKFATGPIGQTIMANGTGYAPGNRKATDDPALLGGFYDARPNLATGVKQLPLMTGWYNWAGSNAVKIVDVIQNHINDVAAGRKTAAETMPRMKRDVDALLQNCP